MSELRECPFCGAHARYDADEAEWVTCANIECNMHGCHVDIDTWNARALAGVINTKPTITRDALGVPV